MAGEQPAVDPFGLRLRRLGTDLGEVFGWYFRRLDVQRFKHRSAGWVPFGLVVAAIVAFAGAGVVWVTSPYWGKKVITAAPRNVGVIPVVAQSTVAPAAFVSPNRIEIPRLGATAPIVDVGVLGGGELDVPLNPKVVGWWKDGARPGAAKGTAILDGHINYAGVEGTLATIGTLDPGDRVYIYGLSATKKPIRLTFTITGVRTYNKHNLPYQQVFDQTSTSRLALVTCGGPFDASSGNYEDNIVAFAVPTVVASSAQ
jgi:sortase family protein